MVLCSHCRKVLFTESREEEVEESGIKLQTCAAKVLLFQQKGNCDWFGHFFSTNDRMLFFLILLK